MPAAVNVPSAASQGANVLIKRQVSWSISSDAIARHGERSRKKRAILKIMANEPRRDPRMVECSLFTSS
jgi:hypothetical protein